MGRASNDAGASPTSHPFRSSDAQQAKAGTQNLRHGIIQPEAGNVTRIDWIISTRSDAALAVPRVVCSSESLEVAGDTVRFT